MYEWNTTIYADANYSLEIIVFENETIEQRSTSDILLGNFTIHNTPPSVFDVRPAENSSFNISQAIEISANATDEIGVSAVLANITFPEGIGSQLLILNNSIGDKYNGSFSVPLFVGQYNITFIANDTLNNVNSTTTTFFAGQDFVPPAVVV